MMHAFVSTLREQLIILLHSYNPSAVVLLFFLFTISFLNYYLFVIYPAKKNKKVSPPSPTKLPVLGNLHQLGLFPHRSLTSLARRYGPLMLLHFGSKPVLIISSAEAAREVCKNHDLALSDRPQISIISKLLYNCRDLVGAQYGEFWRQMRSVCVLHLLSNKMVQSFSAVREEEVGLLIKNVQQLSSLSVPVNLSEMFVSLTNDVICRAACGRKYGDEDEEGRKLKELLKELMRLLGVFCVGDFVPWLSWVNHFDGYSRRADKTAKELDRFLDGVVEQHLNDFERKSKNCGDAPGEPNDLVEVLLKLQKESMINGFSIDRENIKALILDIFAAGTETSYTVLDWAMTELLRHPKVMTELQKEVRAIGDEQHMITESDLERMHYLKMVIKETLRLHPPFPFSPRELNQDIKVMDYNIEAGTMVIINFWALATDSSTWNRPEEFRPERFLENSVDFRSNNDFHLVPFGLGRRKCPGISFAMVVIELVLANLVKKFDWSTPGGANGEDLDITESPGSTIHRKEHLVVLANPSSH